MNLADGLRINSWRNPNKIAAVFEDKRVTYEELNARANQLAHAMLQRGFKRQVTISIVMYNNIEFLTYQMPSNKILHWHFLLCYMQHQYH